MYKCVICGEWVEDAAKCLLNEDVCAACCRAIDDYLYGSAEKARLAGEMLLECSRDINNIAVFQWLQELLK